MNNVVKPVYSDFFIIRRDIKSTSGYVLDILEPHKPTINDNLPKAKGFAEYTEAEPLIGCIQLIRKVNDGGIAKFKLL